MPQLEVKIIKNVCSDCGWKWTPRTETHTKKCPRCQSHKWDHTKPAKTA